MPELTINSCRLSRTLVQLGRIGETGQGGTAVDVAGPNSNSAATARMGDQIAAALQ